VSARSAGAPAMCDKFGSPLAAGDRVVAVCVDDGAPGWAHFGVIVGFGRTRVRVEWDTWSYEPLSSGVRRAPHTPPPSALRKLPA
jgi:hypothetical protein